MTTRIYVASLSDYNAGRLHGKWINANQDADAIQAEITSMLAESKESPAEEWAIHDYEGFGEIPLSEFESIERVSMLATLLDDHEAEVLAVALDNCGKNADAKEIEEWISGHYLGSYRTLEDWAEEYADGTGMLAEVPESLRYYFDFEKWARDAEMSGDIFTRAGGLGVLVFHS